MNDAETIASYIAYLARESAAGRPKKMRLRDGWLALEPDSECAGEVHVGVPPAVVYRLAYNRVERRRLKGNRAAHTCSEVLLAMGDHCREVAEDEWMVLDIQAAQAAQVARKAP